MEPLTHYTIAIVYWQQLSEPLTEQENRSNYMDPITITHMRRIRQQELIQEAEKWRNSEPIWERLWRWIAPMIAARRQKASYASDDCVTVTVPTVADNC